MARLWREVLMSGVLVVLASCGGGGATSTGSVEGATMGTLNASVRMTERSGGPSVTRVQIEVEPAGVFQGLTFDSATGDFIGSVVVPTGQETVTATAYAGTEIVGTGTAVANVSSRGATSVVIKILDNSTAPVAQDHGPIITAITASNTQPGLGDSINIAVTAIDPDGDTISYQWTQDCGGVFGSTTNPTSTWSNASAQSCVLTATATSKGLTDTARIAIVVVDVTPSVSLTAIFVPVPYIDMISLSGNGFNCTVWRTATDASCRPAIVPGSVLTATVTFDAMPADSGGNVTLADGCGGTSNRTALDLAGGTATFTWTAPGSPASCQLTATATRESLSDAEKIAVAVALP